MSKATYHFPKGFLWGTATSSHQVEGGNTNNNWHEWENQPGRIHNGDRSGQACDWWGGRWQEDLHNAAEGGQNAHRFSIEWSRVQPQPDCWDDSALDHYRQMITGMRRMGLTPFATLHHFTEPLWIYEIGSWENEQTVTQFAAFVRRAVEKLGDLVDFWITINEPEVYTTGGYVGGGFPPAKNDLKAAFNVMRNLLKGHAVAYRIIHELHPRAMVGFAKNYRAFEPARSWFPPDVCITKFTSAGFNDAFSDALLDGQLKFAFYRQRVPEAVGTQDFIGINYYSMDKVVFKPLAFRDVFHRRFYPDGAWVSETGFIANLPIGMYQALQWARRFRLPIYITENGVEDSQDNMRPAYLVEHLHQVWRAANHNWDVRGYFHWSQVDNFEWERAWSQRFGLWGLDVKTQQRFRRPSADLYAAICRENGVTSDVVSRWAPDAFERLFPK